MAVKYADEFRADLAEFRDKTKKFYNKEMKVPEYKGFSGGFGSYAQRGGEASMLRLRLTGGQVSKEKLKFIVESMEKYNIDLAHFTTCQTLQLHNLSCDTVCTLIEEAWDHGMITRGGGGDYPRNVMVSPLTGVEEEPFELTEYAKAASDYLMTFIKGPKFPRKLKVCFSNSKTNWPHATFRDLGFVAKENGTFDVYSAGGLGNNPKMGALVAENAAPEKILYYIKAMVETFIAHGNYENRGRARTRYMQDTLGTEGYVKAYQEKLAEIVAKEDIDITVEHKEITKQGNGENIIDMRVIPQKQEGLFAVLYHPYGGNPTPKKLRELYDTIADMQEVELRITPNEEIYIINCNAAEAKKVLEVTDDGAKTLFETSVACIGNSICQVGVGDSQAMLRKCLDAVIPEKFADGVLPKIRISGCPSSCSAHQIAPIGLRGAMKQTKEGPKAAFALFEDGNDMQGQEKFGTDLAVMIVEDIPKFFVELGRIIQQENKTYDSWILKNHDAFMELVEKYR